MSMTENPLPLGRLVRGLVLGGGVRLLMVDARAAAEETRIRHGLAPVAARLAAEGIVAAQLMSAHIKGDERITLQVQSERPPFALFVDVFSNGSLRARFTPSHVPSQPTFNGILSAVKHDADKIMYQGVAPVEDQTFEAALQGYFVKSQQAVGHVRLEARTSVKGVQSARGLLVEKLPGMESELFEEIFGDLPSRPVDGLMDDMAAGHIFGLPIEVLETRDVRFQCTCSLERARGLMKGLGRSEVEDLLRTQGKAEMTCHFCNEVYELEQGELETILEELDAGIDKPPSRT